ncbi:hypothetical protein E3J61_00925 [Candidatus Dependentiae bacterium]|nr:MAG: hypothetical protein E3J61_00925 [Candidatus Dependentiae bacterium]
MNKALLFSVVLLISGSNISAMDPFSRMFCPNPIVLKSWQEKELLQQELASIKRTLEMLDERARKGEEGPVDDLIKQDCLERKDSLFNRLQRAKHR